MCLLFLIAWESEEQNRSRRLGGYPAILSADPVAFECLDLLDQSIFQMRSHLMLRRMITTTHP
ncbi:hypothetical protein FKM82_006830 [Ascaphus truei]